MVSQMTENGAIMAISDGGVESIIKKWVKERPGSANMTTIGTTGAVS